MPAEAQVRASIATATQAASRADSRGVVAPLSDDFDGNAGELDRRTLANMIRVAHLRGEHVGVTVGPITIEHRGERMVATFTLALTSGGRLFPDQMGVHRVETAWRQEHGKWLCYSASWQRAM
ncbi:MAG: hypothetical protein ABI114_14495 [Rhodanobacter sp.]